MTFGKKHNHRTEKRSEGAKAKGRRIFWGDGNVLYLHCFNTTTCICQNPEKNCTLKRVVALYTSYTSIDLTCKNNTMLFAFSFSFSLKCTRFARSSWLMMSSPSSQGNASLYILMFWIFLHFNAVNSDRSNQHKHKALLGFNTFNTRVSETQKFDNHCPRWWGSPEES